MDGALSDWNSSPNSVFPTICMIKVEAFNHIEASCNLIVLFELANLSNDVMSSLHTNWHIAKDYQKSSIAMHANDKQAVIKNQYNKIYFKQSLLNNRCCWLLCQNTA